MGEKRQSKADKIAQMRARLQQLESEQTAADRKADARRKIILGGAVIAEMSTDPDFHQAVAGILRKRVVKPKDQEAVQQWLSTGSPPASLPGQQATAAPPPPPTGPANG